MVTALLLTGLLAGLATAAYAGEPREITAKGPEGNLAGTLIPAAKGKPTLLIIPGSGPTDRDGNNPLGVTASSYRMLAEALGERGIGSIRIDKRGMFGSAAAIPNPNDVTITAYAEDVHAWIAAARDETGAECLWVLGHSEGGLVALQAAQEAEGVCGVLLVASVGRPIGTILREQLQANPANAPIMSEALGAIEALEAGERVSVKGMHPALVGLFNPAVQSFLIDMMSRDPATLASSLTVPALIVTGGKDLQTPVSDGEALAAGQSAAKFVVVPDMNHVLKRVEADDRPSNLATYANASLPIHSALVEAIADFVSAEAG
ncbi:MAG: alpha/beta fold hydrolase [Erythrobacter sp.]|nr:alpha/beta fold hydrolase [Erythrobacter sp.]